MIAIFALSWQVQKWRKSFLKNIISLIEQMLPELQKIEKSDRINYVFTTIKYFFEVGETPNQDKFRDVIQRGLTKSGDEIMTFAEQLRFEGYQEGISQGISQGINQGINRGKIEIAWQGMEA